MAAAIVKAHELRERGKELFQAGDYKGALVEYHQIYMYVTGFSMKGGGSAEMMSSMLGGAQQSVTDEEMTHLRELKFVHFSNVGLCHFKLGNLPKCVTYCTKVTRACGARGARARATPHHDAPGCRARFGSRQALELDPNHIKCLFRRGKCLLELGQLDAARDDLVRVQELDGQNREVLVELKRLREALAAHDREESKKYVKMFS